MSDMSKRNNLSKLKFGNWTVLKYDTYKPGGAYWICRCSCGTIRSVLGENLIKGRSVSCGCSHKPGLAHDNQKLHNVWKCMKARCYYKNHTHYNSYGGRGISVCDEWINNFRAFYEWAMANGYREGLTIDRIDVNGNYEPSNCQWLTKSENSKKAIEDRRKSHGI